MIFKTTGKKDILNSVKNKIKSEIHLTSYQTHTHTHIVCAKVLKHSIINKRNTFSFLSLCFYALIKKFCLTSY